MGRAGSRRRRAARRRSGDRERAERALPRADRRLQVPTLHGVPARAHAVRCRQGPQARPTRPLLVRHGSRDPLMRRLVCVAAIVAALAGTPALATPKEPGPTLRTPAARLAAALHCPATFTHPAREPVLLVQGTN